MLARQRHDEMMTLLEQQGIVRVRELARRLGVSEMTVRRDLDQLASSGVVEKFHGGATLKERPTTDEPGFEAKRERQLDEKRAIAAEALNMIPSGSAVGLTAGTTTWMLAQLLGSVTSLTVVTNAVSVAQALYKSRAGNPGIEVVLTGGVRTPSDALVGPVATATLGTMNIDTLFMGVHGFSHRSGFTSPNIQEAETNRAFMRCASRVVVLADHTKYGTTGLSTIAPLADADVVVTDIGLDQQARDTMEESVGDLRLVEPQRTKPRR